MIIYSENFDQVKDAADLIELFGYSFYRYTNYGRTLSTYYLSEDVSISDVNPNTEMVENIGDMQGRSLYGEKPFAMYLPEFKPSKRIILGMSIGSGTYAETQERYTSEAYLYERSFMSNCRFRISFKSDKMENYTTLEESGVLFSILFSANNKTIDISFDNHNENLTAISPEEGVPFNVYRKNFFEVYVDSQGADSGTGTVKVAINGQVVAERENVITSNYEGWGGDAMAEGSFFKHLLVGLGSSSDDWIPDMIVDSIYVCNEEGGVHDDFLGPVHISTFYPDSVNLGDKNNWVGFKDQVKTEEANASLVNSPAIDFSAEDEDYIEAETDNLEELYYMKNDIDPIRAGVANPLAVNFTTFVKDIFGYGDQSFDKNLMAITKPTGNVVTRELNSKIPVDQYTYKPLDVYFGVVPNLAVPWTWALVDETQFGMESAPKIFNLLIADETDISDSSTDS
jgi:hypothetical protein